MTRKPTHVTTASCESSIMLDVQQLSALQQLSSPALPIGGFSYSQGLEAAVELGLVHDEASAHEWIAAHLDTVVIDGDAPLWCLLYRAWQAGDDARVTYWNDWFHASRETHELRLEATQMGDSLARLVRELEWGSATERQRLARIQPMTLALVHSFACAAWDVPEVAGLSAYLFTWLENQVTAAIKSVPLGQVSAQRVLNAQRLRLPQLMLEALQRSHAEPPDLQTLAPQYSIISSRHESQFSRLFRS